MPSVTKKVCNGDSDMERFAKEYSLFLTAGDKAIVVALSGELGSGKTTFARGILRAHGITEAVTSPTFVIEKIYTPPRGTFKTIVHMDAYRLKDARELVALDFENLIGNSNTLVLIEWPEHIASAIPQTARKISFVIGEGAERTIIYES